ncbi:hypothetical protein F0562_015487 [Nyssa sinensis]|uniref:Uncharacterized protein n=1 Tax=Nyssa sinensis TaxID=561372 RepID=A0A5J4ZH66_9ASTE|nr:hypothetical protein F0562_015487 [Nyssa sinensis]
MTESHYQVGSLDASQGVNAFFGCSESELPARHAASAASSDIMVVRTPLTTQEALELEKDYGGFSLNADFLIHQSSASSGSSPIGGCEGSSNSSRGEWTARHLGASSSSLHNVSDTFATAVMQLPKPDIQSIPLQVVPSSAPYRRMDAATNDSRSTQQPSDWSAPNPVQSTSALVHRIHAEKASSRIQSAPPTTPHGRKAAGPPGPQLSMAHTDVPPIPFVQPPTQHPRVSATTHISTPTPIVSVPTLSHMQGNLSGTVDKSSQPQQSGCSESEPSADLPMENVAIDRAGTTVTELCTESMQSDPSAELQVDIMAIDQAGTTTVDPQSTPLSSQLTGFGVSKCYLFLRSIYFRRSWGFALLNFVGSPAFMVPGGLLYQRLDELLWFASDIHILAGLKLVNGDNRWVLPQCLQQSQA